MTITITDADGNIEDIKAAVVKALIEEHGQKLSLVSAAQACGILDMTMNTFIGLKLPKVDLSGKGQIIRYRLEDIEALIEERTLLSLTPRVPRRRRAKVAG